MATVNKSITKTQESLLYTNRQCAAMLLKNIHSHFQFQKTYEYHSVKLADLLINQLLNHQNKRNNRELILKLKSK